MLTKTAEDEEPLKYLDYSHELTQKIVKNRAVWYNNDELINTHMEAICI